MKKAGGIFIIIIGLFIVAVMGLMLVMKPVSVPDTDDSAYVIGYVAGQLGATVAVGVIGIVLVRVGFRLTR